MEGMERDPMCRHAGRQAVFEIGSGWHQTWEMRKRERGIERERLGYWEEKVLFAIALDSLWCLR